ncbi:unnamed protein product [Cuscuta epithymum]|uniref:Uncharacterized protein n=1 Tax=Cuscuta epithymum TaxID=186058 RepID=A0AAV0EUH8_9ASTE|nr:unnamed protein product [Cuscuta epithymum]
MEVSAAIVELDNKENIPPRSAEILNSMPSKEKSLKKKKKGRTNLTRKPLRDITHLIVNTPIAISLCDFPSLLPPEVSSNPRKRRAADDDEDGEDKIRIHSFRKKSAMIHFR